MKKLWVASIIVATLESIYPFNFQAVELDSATIGAFLQSCCKMPGRGDVLGNVILFVPIGFTGMIAARPGSPGSRRFFLVCAIAAFVAFALQTMQFFLPSRDENLQDVLWNLVGAASGAASARLVTVFSTPTEVSKSDISLVPLVLVGTWLIYRLIPFVPSIDLQLFKDSLRPVFEFHLAPENIIHDTSAWLVIAYLLRIARRGVRLDARLPLLMFTVFCLEVLIVDNLINFSNLAGAMLALLLWRGRLSYVRRQEGVLVVLLISTIAVTGLAPFEFGANSAPFNWLPFSGFLSGSMYLNTQSAVEKVFLYGSLVYLLWRTEVSIFTGTLLSFSFVAIVELAQMRLVGHTPEITDPLLVVFAALTLWTLERQERKSNLDGRIDTIFSQELPKPVALSHVRPTGHFEKWKSQTVNLRAHQFDFLVQLSKEMGVSVSRLTRRIVAEFIESLEDETAFAPRYSYNTADSELGNDKEKWVRQSVNLRGSQFQFLYQLSQEMGISVSGITRRIIAQFIGGLEDEDKSG